MRVLCLTNFYPPATQGGYEIWCQEVSEGLRQRHHQVEVLTTRLADRNIPRRDPAWVHRELHPEMDFSPLFNSITFFTRRTAREQENLAILRRRLRDPAPDVVLVWGMWNLSRALPALAEQLLPGRVVYYMGDYWPTLPSQYERYWQVEARNGLTALPKRLLRKRAQRILAREETPVLEFQHVLFPTEFLRAEYRQLGVVMGHTQVVYGGAATQPFVSDAPLQPARPDGAIELLYVGRVTEDKGVHTAIEALGQLVQGADGHRYHLHVVGAADPAYQLRLQELVQGLGLAQAVTFEGGRPKPELPALYHQADILVFPSIWAEPFGRVLVEAMAAGLVVVSTAVGGTAEIVIDGETGLLCPPGDAGALASQVRRLAAAPELRRRLAAMARRRAIEHFDSAHMTAGIEAYLQQVCAQPQPAG